MSPLLDVQGLEAGYGRIAVLFGINLTVNTGEVVALLGANGAGKTTTLRAISGLIEAKAGTIQFEDQRINGMPAERIARLGLTQIPEGRGVFPSLQVEETLRLAASVLPKSEIPAALERAYSLFPVLAERRTQAVGSLSGGQRQMMALSRAVIVPPKLLMLDEPSQGLAPVVCDELFAVIGSLAHEGVAILIVEQFVSRALELAQRAYVLTKGEVSFDGTAAELAADEDFVAGSYLGHVDEETLEAAIADEASIELPRLDPERTPLVADVPAEVRAALEQLAMERGVAPEALVAELVAREVGER
ncbi:MAG: branched-chain amino acid transport system ATP-binding protein [Acidimicrobiaceae bacterium]|jgi:branched-chain amino acid transport system ATP-binding protein